jgi:hypothetical protein
MGQLEAMVAIGDLGVAIKLTLLGCYFRGMSGTIFSPWHFPFVHIPPLDNYCNCGGWNCEVAMTEPRQSDAALRMLISITSNNECRSAII